MGPAEKLSKENASTSDTLQPSNGYEFKKNQNDVLKALLNSEKHKILLF